MIKNNPIRRSPVFVLENELAYLQITKAGQSSIASFMRNCSDHRFIRVDKDTPLDAYKHYYSFSIVRNPWDRMVSCFKNKIRQPNILDEKTGVDIIFSEYGNKFSPQMTFKDFLKAIITIDPDKLDPHIASQYQLLCDVNKNIIVDYVGKFEKITKEIQTIWSAVGLKYDNTFPHLNKTNHDHYREYYDEECLDIVQKIDGFIEDVTIFGYEF